MVYFWIALIVVFVIVEVLTIQLVTIWFALGSLGALIANLLGAAEWVQWLVFFAVSVVALIATRPLVKKFKRCKTVPTNADRYIGAKAVVTQAIDNEAGTGQVKVEGSVWTARSVDGSQIAEGEPVTVTAIEGVKLMVARKES